MRILPFAALLIAVFVPTSGQTTESRSSRGGAEQAVTGRVNEFFAALRKGDVDALGPFYTDDYILTTEEGAVRTKRQRLERLKAGDAAGLATVKPSDLRVRAYGDAAVVTGLVTITDGGEVIRERFTHVWVRQGGAWRMAAGQITTVAPTTTPGAPSEKKP